MSRSEIGKVYAVDDVQVMITKNLPPTLIIHALGRVSTTGWSVGELSQYIYLLPPKDGVQEFDFNARRPPEGAIVLNVLTPISAHAELTDIDIANYWGRGIPLTGIRVHAVANDKTVDIADHSKEAGQRAAMGPKAIASFVSTTDAAAVPGFKDDIRPLFRPKDVTVMQMFGGFDLSKYEDVKRNVERILEKLRTDMPCDGLWPASDIAKLEAWKNGGMPA